MQILVNTDHHISGRENLSTYVESVVEQALDRFSDRITRVEVHLGDVNSHKGGDNDIRCMMEARVEGLRPLAVTDQAATLDQALDGAADKLKKSIGSTLDRLSDH